MGTSPLIGSKPASTVGLGCNNFGTRCDEAQTRRVVAAALDAGINVFDTADSYGGTLSESYLGAALGARRDQVIVATKFGSPHSDGEGGAHPDYVRRACEASLRRLGTDHIDLYQLHFPDSNVPMADTLGALDELVRAGKVIAIGCSNFTSEMLRDAATVAADRGLTSFSTLQNEYSLLQRRPEQHALAACAELGVGFLPYFPLASGVLTGKYRRGEPTPEGTRLASMPAERAERLLSEQHLDVVERLSSYAEAKDHTLLELAISWLVTRPGVVSVIAGATRPEQVTANVEAAKWAMTEAEAEEISRLAPPA